VVWVLGADGKPQSRRIKIGLTDGVSTEVVEGNLQEGELAITSETLSAASKSAPTQTAPGFGGGQRTPGAGGAGGRRN
jgi:multidrug efflux pump subunit AcrA (membrane-fusion protein)